MDLSKATDDQLRAELERRSKVKPACPQPKPNVDFQPVLTMLNEMVEKASTDEYWEEDNDQYLYECLINAVYGPAFWDWARYL